MSLTGANIPLEIGSIVADKFRIERVLAEGGMGLVVAATHIQLEQTVALKFFRGDLRSSGEPLLRFMREAKAAAQIKSEYVARVLDVGVTDDGTPYMVMEYLEGQGLEKVIAIEGRLDISSAVEYAIQACEGLAEAHARGIVHRDIKPSNLFLTERSPGWRTIKILDFGISKVSLAQASNITTNLNLVMGTPCYMSPEQFQSAAGVDHRSDIWSLGSTLFEMLAGRPPFDPGLPLLAMAESIVKKDPPTLRELRPEIPQELSDVVGRCMVKDRERRIPSAAGLAIALLPFAPGRAGATAERAAAITPAHGLRESEQRAQAAARASTRDPAEDAKAELQFTQIGFASPTPPARESPLPLSSTMVTPMPATVSVSVTPMSATPPSVARPAVPGVSVTPAMLAQASKTMSAPPSTLVGGATALPVAAGGAPGAALVPFGTTFNATPLPDGDVSGPWQPKTSGVVITAVLLVLGVVVLAVLRSSPSARAPAPAMTVAPTRPAPAPPAAPGASTNELVVHVSPSSAQIMIDGAIVAGNPFRGRFPGGVHQIQAFAAGYEPKVQQASLATDVVVDFSLDRRSRSSPGSSSSNRQSPPAAQARMPPPGQTGRPQPTRQSVASRPTVPPPAVAPGVVSNEVVDPRGGRSPLHPIETRSPYKNQ